MTLYCSQGAGWSPNAAPNFALVCPDQASQEVVAISASSQLIPRIARNRRVPRLVVDIP